MKVSYSVSEEKHLWEDFLSGDLDAFDKIYNDNISVLYNYAKKFSTDSYLIEDTIQELFVDLWDKRNRLGKTDNIKLYLLKSIRRRLLRLLKNEQKLATLQNEYTSYFDMAIEPTLKKENQQKVEIKLNQAVNQLSDVQKEIVFLKFYNNCSYEEIAEVLGLSRHSVYNGMFNAMKSLRKKL